MLEIIIALVCSGLLVLVCASYCWSRKKMRFNEAAQAFFDYWDGNPDAPKDIPVKLQGVFWMVENPADEMFHLDGLPARPCQAPLHLLSRRGVLLQGKLCELRVDLRLWHQRVLAVLGQQDSRAEVIDEKGNKLPAFDDMVKSIESGERHQDWSPKSVMQYIPMALGSCGNAKPQAYDKLGMSEQLKP